MSNIYSTPEAPQQFNAAPQMPSRPPVKKKRRWVMPVALVAVFILGSTIGAVSKPTPEPVTIEKVVEKKVQVEVPVTPSSCKKALELAGKVIDISATTTGIMRDTINYVADRDIAGINRQTEKVKIETGKLDEIGPSYRSTRDSCLAG